MPRTATNHYQTSNNRRYTQARQEYYVDGNVIRKVQTKEQPVKKRKRKVDPEYREAKMVKTSFISKSLSFILILSVITTIYIIYNYLLLKASVNYHQSNVASMQTELSNLQINNDNLEKSIEDSLDLNETYRIATEELGMVPVNKNSIIQYDKTESEYVKQGEDIPLN